MQHPLAIAAVALLLAACAPRYTAETCVDLKGEESDRCWFRVAVESGDFTNCANVGDSALRNLCQRDPLQEDRGSSSSAVTASSAEATSSASSAPIGFTGPVAPFDACPGIETYDSYEWYPAMKHTLMNRETFSRITEACMSDDFVIMAVHTEGINVILRYDLRTKTLEQPSQVDSKPAPVASSFGKRVGDLIPLMHAGCRSGTYDIRTNTIKADGNDCSKPYCSGGLGEDYWPSSPNYKHLKHLGPVFTAAECGPDRLKQVLHRGTFTVGSTIFLKARASDALEQELIAAGYSCTDDTCLSWRNQSESIEVPTLLRLRPYVGEMKGDDCFYCG